MRVSGSLSPRRISTSRSGRYVAIRQEDGLSLVDGLGTAPRVHLPFADMLDFACVGPNLWVVAGGRLHRFSLDGGEKLATAVDMPVEHGRLYPTSSGNAHSALWLGYGGRLLVQDLDGEMSAEDITGEAGAGAFVGLLGGRRLLVADGGFLRVRDAGRASDIARAPLPVPGQVVAASSLFRGQAMAVLVEGEDGDTFLILRPNGALVHRIAMPRTRLCVIADIGGVALVHDPAGDRLMALDLRYGRVRARVEPPMTIEALGIDADGRYVTLAGFEEPASPGPRSDDDSDDARDEPDDEHDAAGETHASDQELAVLHLPYTDVFGGGRAQPVEEAEGNGAAAHAPDGSGSGEGVRSLATRETAAGVDAAQGGAAMPLLEEPEPEPEPIIIPKIPLLGLGRVMEVTTVRAPRGRQYRPYASLQEHLEDLLGLVAARAHLAIARAWNSGRLSAGADDALPYQREVDALVGQGGAYAPDAEAAAEARLAEVAETCGGRTNASLAAGASLPFIDITREFDLNVVEGQVLLLAAAPQMRGEIARLYGILANDEHRPVCDRHLIEMVLGGDNAQERKRVARAMAADGTLIKFGLLRAITGRGEDSLFLGLTVDPVLTRRLRGDRFGGAGPTEVTTIRRAEPALEDLLVPDELKRDLVLALARPPRDGRPYRVLLRGRRGAGRRSLAAALAARVDRPLAVIDCERMPRAGLPFAQSLEIELLRAGLRGAVACVSGLEVFDATDAEGMEHLRAVFRSHPGPVIIRTSPEHRAPLDPGYLSFTLPPLSESERLAFWRGALAAHGMRAEGVERLASRFRIGPGTIESVISGVEARMDDEDKAEVDAGELLDTAARQHIEGRMNNVASHVTRLPGWEQVALPDDMLDSVREFIGRVRHRRTVYEHWGYDTTMSTSRGLTALFYGPPGTGKTMVAGLIARELNLDLYRVDLARITSKWIGETEKNLAEVFDAAEDGQAIILFDEADSLFGKRTSEVKSSVDRYANLEVNYLLQRLDTFEGVAILTTNLEGAVDKAFKRRMSLRLAFPFPDEDMRVRLWAAHIPPEAPTTGDFDLEDLARRFPMSGGFIRNSALRAAFLAAQENVSMTHDHLVRAVHLEYREMGKLSPGGRME